MSSEVIVKIGQEKYTTEVIIANHSLIVDEPESVGGQNLGPTPTSLLLSSLGTCKAITMRMYADQKKWPLEGVEIGLAMEVVKSNLQQSTYVRVHIKLIGDLDDQQRERILKISEKCPVHKILSNPIVIETNMIL